MLSPSHVWVLLSVRVLHHWYELNRSPILADSLMCVTKTHTGGHIVSFVCTLPGLGPGQLVPLESSDRDQTLEDKKLYVPRDVEWNNLGEACADAGVGVTMFIAPTKFLDIASIGTHLNS